MNDKLTVDKKQLTMYGAWFRRQPLYSHLNIPSWYFALRAFVASMRAPQKKDKTAM
jgi:hypothetical protein